VAIGNYLANALTGLEKADRNGSLAYLQKALKAWDSGSP
jgi:hypothetical protein